MPAKSARQRRTAGMALRYKRMGKLPRGGPARRMAKSMTKRQLKKFARKAKSKRRRR